MKSNKIYYAKTAEVINSKDVSCWRIIFCKEFLPIFQILVFELQVPVNEIRRPTVFELVLFRVFNGFGFIDVVLCFGFLSFAFILDIFFMENIG